MPTKEELSNPQQERLVDVVATALKLEGSDQPPVFQSDHWVITDRLPATGWNKSLDGDFFLLPRKLFESAAISKSTTFIASSRLPKNLQTHTAWFDALRTISVKLDPDSQSLLTSPKTTADAYVRRIAELFSIDLIELKELDRNSLSHLRPDETPANNVIYLIRDDHRETIDFGLVQLAQTVYALAVSSNGNIDQAISRRLERGDDQDPNALTWLLSCQGKHKPLTTAKTRQRLLEQGAVDWMLVPNSTASGDTQPSETHCGIVALASIDSSEFLLHWTRRQTSHWPDQNEADHIDRLLFGSVESRYRAVMTLCRIIATRRLIASANLTRSETPVVCFSQVPVGELPQRTVFRSHLARWDFVPYGIAIRKEILQNSGCRKVVYGDDTTWDSMKPEQRPWFQLASSADGKIDWTQEREWRLVGDLDLKKVGPDDAFAFVKTNDEAKALGEICHWPIVVLDENGQDD